MKLSLLNGLLASIGVVTSDLITFEHFAKSKLDQCGFKGTPQIINDGNKYAEAVSDDRRQLLAAVYVVVQDWRASQRLVLCRLADRYISGTDDIFQLCNDRPPLVSNLRKSLLNVNSIQNPTDRCTYYSLALRHGSRVSPDDNLVFAPGNEARLVERLFMQNYNLKVQIESFREPFTAEQQLVWDVKLPHLRESSICKEQFWLLKWLERVDTKRERAIYFLFHHKESVALATIGDLLELFGIIDHSRALNVGQLINCRTFLQCKDYIERTILVANPPVNLQNEMRNLLENSNFIDESHLPISIEKFGKHSLEEQQSIYKIVTSLFPSDHRQIGSINEFLAILDNEAFMSWTFPEWYQGRSRTAAALQCMKGFKSGNPVRNVTKQLSLFFYAAKGKLEDQSDINLWNFSNSCQKRPNRETVRNILQLEGISVSEDLFEILAGRANTKRCNELEECSTMILKTLDTIKEELSVRRQEITKIVKARNKIDAVERSLPQMSLSESAGLILSMEQYGIDRLIGPDQSDNIDAKDVEKHVDIDPTS